jgi:hypothetical protein
VSLSVIVKIYIFTVNIRGDTFRLEILTVSLNTLFRYNLPMKNRG